jgi:GC-rich sequence DNA-binding factor
MAGLQTALLMGVLQYLVMSFVAQYRIAAHRLRSFILPHMKEIRQPSTSTGMEGITARQAFLHRCLKLLTNALRWRKYAKQTLLPTGHAGEGLGAGQTLQAALVHELVERTMLPVIEAGWETGGSAIASRVSILSCCGLESR